MLSHEMVGNLSFVTVRLTPFAFVLLLFDSLTVYVTNLIFFT